MTATVQIDPRQFEDPRWRLSNLYKVVDENGQVQSFRPNDAQLEFMDNIHSRNIILKARKLGFTTFCCLIYLDACIFNPNTEAAVIAHKREDAEKIFRTKVKWPYDQLPEALRERVNAVNDSARVLSFANHSFIGVTASARSGTPQYLHVSEFGKLCAMAPGRALEVVTGSLNAVPRNGFVVIESTAEGQDGPFYTMTTAAMAQAERGETLTNLDYKFHFFPWWQDKRNVLETEGIVLTVEDERYFARLEADGISLTQGQKNWYVKQERTQESAMKRENPSTPREAFEQALEGAYFEQQLAIANKHGRIGGFPFDPRYMVNTFWDLGRNDLNAIWLHQYIAGYHRFIGYYQNSGEHISHYIKWLREWGEERQAVFGEHYLPHDGDRESLWLPEGTMGVMHGLHFYPQTVERPVNKTESINSARSVFVRCQFDEAGTSEGLKMLRLYRKEWDDRRGVWKDKPYHGPESNGCLLAGEMVTTRRGLVPIEVVKIGDQVWTPSGWSDVANAGPTKRATELVDVWSAGFRVLTCTPEHKLLTRRGFVTARSLTTTDELLTGREWTCRLVGFVSMVASIGFRGTITGNIAGQPLASRPSTEPSTRRCSARFQRGLRFITASIKTMVGSTTIPQIFKLSMPPNTNEGICFSGMPTGSCDHRAKPRSKPLPSGTVRQKGGIGTADTASVHGTVASGWRLRVRNVVSHLGRLTLRAPSSAITVAAITRRDGGPDSPLVYDLTVTKNACYQANGVLVSNSDAFQTFACSNVTETERLVAAEKADRHRRRMYGARKPNWRTA